MGSLFDIKLAAQDTGGVLELAEVTQPSGVATPLHRHRREAEIFYVLDGELDYEAGGTMHHLAAGSAMYLPAEVPHRFRIVGSEPARLLVLVSPGGLFDIYREVGVSAEARSLPSGLDPTDIGRWNQAAPSFGLEVLGPPLG